MKLNKKEIQQMDNLIELFGITKEDAIEQFKTILKSEKVTKQAKGSQRGVAMRILAGKVSEAKDKSSFGGKPVDVTIRVEMKEEPTEFKRRDGAGKGYRSSIYCTAQVADGDPFFTVLTLWGDANEINPEMVVGTTYTTKAIPNGNALSINNPEVLTVIEDKLPEMKDVIVNSYPVVKISDAGDKENISDDWNDLKLIEGVVSGAWHKETVNGNPMGFLKIMDDDDNSFSMVAKFSRIAEQVDYYDTGSLIYVLGQITAPVYDEDTGEIKYDVSAWGNLVVPIEALEKDVEESDPEDNDDDVDDIEGGIEDGEDDEDDADWDIDDEEDWG